MLAILLAVTSSLPRDSSREDTGKCREPQIKRVFCKPICKPDAAQPGETGETEPTERDLICPVRRDHRTRERLPETPETYVVLLITQRCVGLYGSSGRTLTARCGVRQTAPPLACPLHRTHATPRAIAVQCQHRLKIDPFPTGEI
jgi:hypothetical protein